MFDQLRSVVAEHMLWQCIIDVACAVCIQVLGGEEILQLPKKTEELVPGAQSNMSVSFR